MDPLSGCWFQITYDPDHNDQVWSIEVTDIKNHGQFVQGTMWRVWPTDFDRRWDFSGRFHDAYVRSQYWSTRGDGGEGSLKMYRYNNVSCLGRFETERAQQVDFSPAFVEFSAPLEWIRFGSDGEASVIEKLTSDTRYFADRQLPLVVRRRLRARMRSDPFDGVVGALAYGSSLQGTDGLLAAEAEHRRVHQR